MSEDAYPCGLCEAFPCRCHARTKEFERRLPKAGRSLVIWIGAAKVRISEGRIKVKVPDSWEVDFTPKRK